MNEHEIQNQIRLAISEANAGIAWRANVGQAWTGDSWLKHGDGSLTLYNARPFSTGLPRGFSDLFGVSSDGRAFFIEVKAPGGRTSHDQACFIEVVREWGALGGIAHSPEQALQILRQAQK